MGEVIPPKTFRKWQAVINNNSCVDRVTELRTKRNILALNRVTLEEHAEFMYTEKEMAQIDLLTNFLLDINEADPDILHSVEVESNPKGIA